MIGQPTHYIFLQYLVDQVNLKNSLMSKPTNSSEIFMLWICIVHFEVRKRETRNVISPAEILQGTRGGRDKSPRRCQTSKRFNGSSKRLLLSFIVGNSFKWDLSLFVRGWSPGGTHLGYRKVPKVAAPVTFGISRPEGLQLSGGRYFRVAITFG